jgi:peptidoglycan-associated lipoprotein
MNVKTVAAFAALSLLAACSSNKPAQVSMGAGGGTMTPPAAGITPGSEEDLVANVGDKVFFATDRSSLSPESQGTLDRQSAWLAKYGSDNVQIAGNCDERGTEEYNIALGQRRANAARDYLVAKGVASSRITTISYGKDRPTALGSNEDAWKQNRNATTSVK